MQSYADCFILFLKDVIYMTIGERIKAYRLRKNLTQAELAEKLNVAKQTVFKYETGIVTNIPSDKIELMSQIFGVTPAELMGWKQTPATLVPVVGDIKGGYPIEIVEEILDYEEISEDMASKGEYIALRVKGDSMAPKISEGDVAIIHWQPTIENGQIAAVRINGETATLKKFYQNGSQVTLVSLNPSYPPMVYDLREDDVEILGRLVELRAKF